VVALQRQTTQPKRQHQAAALQPAALPRRQGPRPEIPGPMFAWVIPSIRLRVYRDQKCSGSGSGLLP